MGSKVSNDMEWGKEPRIRNRGFDGDEDGLLFRVQVTVTCPLHLYVSCVDGIIIDDVMYPFQASLWEKLLSKITKLQLLMSKYN